jgi:hypothetical protein
MFEVLFIYPKVLARHRAGQRQSIETAISRIALAQALHTEPCCALPGNCSSSPSGST